MKNYKRIIAAIDVYSEYDEVLQSALCIMKEPSQLHLVFVTIPPSYFQPYISSIGFEYVTDITLQAAKQLTQIARKFGIPLSNIHTPIGDIATQICKIASDIDVDLIVVGTHAGSKGGTLLSSVTNSIMHCAKKDVLTVKNDEQILVV